MRFHLIDRIREFEAGKRVVAVKNVTMESDYLEQHFPGIPIFPGVLLQEAMAQASGYLVARTAQELKEELTLPVLQSVIRVRFIKFVRPGDQVLVESCFLSRAPRLASTHVTARVEGDVVARGILQFVLASGGARDVEALTKKMLEFQEMVGPASLKF